MRKLLISFLTMTMFISCKKEVDLLEYNKSEGVLKLKNNDYIIFMLDLKKNDNSTITIENRSDLKKIKLDSIINHYKTNENLGDDFEIFALVKKVKNIDTLNLEKDSYKLIKFTPKSLELGEVDFKLIEN